MNAKSSEARNRSERDNIRGAELRAYAPNLGCILDASHVVVDRCHRYSSRHAVISTRLAIRNIVRPLRQLAASTSYAVIRHACHCLMRMLIRCMKFLANVNKAASTVYRSIYNFLFFLSIFSTKLKV